MVKYSVIVPVYKVEAVLPRCIESILNQTVPDFELILIDDGSPDRSGAICDEYAEKDERIRVIHQQNGGVSRARNAGLDAAQGQYVVFVDSDDYINKEFLEILDADDCDLAVSGTVTYEADDSIRAIVAEPYEEKKILTEEDCIECLKKWYSLQVFAKRFKLQIINENSLRFDEGFSYGEDSIFMAEYLLLIDSIRIQSEVTYNYCTLNAESLTKQAEKNWFVSYCAIQERLLDVFGKNNMIKGFVANRFCWAVENELKKICKSGISKREKKKKIRWLLRCNCLKVCLAICRKDIAAHLKLACRFRMPEIILLFYS